VDIHRGDIFMVCFDPVFGREMGGFKLRPCVVISINDINKATRLVTVVPGTGTTRPSTYNNIIAVPASPENGLEKQTQFQCHQVRAIERGRLTAKPIGKLERDHFAKIEQALSYCLGLPKPM
jgi:mRNA-degrading endonuclease toxin of MazEF toxin-antitoxin module